MPGDPKRPIDGEIHVSCGDMQAGGKLAGLSIAGVREFVAQNLPEFVIPPSKIAIVTTMETEDAAWKEIASEENLSMLTMPTSNGIMIYQGASKIVPETYVLRAADIALSFEDPVDAPA